MGTEDVKVTAMNMYKYKERLRSFSSHGLLPSDLVAQSVERRRSNPKVVGSIPTLVRVFLVSVIYFDLSNEIFVCFFNFAESPSTI